MNISIISYQCLNSKKENYEHVNKIGNKVFTRDTCN